MKKLLILMLLATITLSSCKWFNGLLNKEQPVDTLAIWEAKQDSINKLEMLKAKKIEEEMLAKQQAEQDSLKRLQENRFHVIIGSFKVPTNADGYQQSVTAMGFSNPRIVESKNGFRMVSVAAFDTYSKAFNEIRRINMDKEEPTELWIYEANF
jgi:hypothetical protein